MPLYNVPELVVKGKATLTPEKVERLSLAFKHHRHLANTAENYWDADTNYAAAQTIGNILRMVYDMPLDGVPQMKEYREGVKAANKIAKKSKGVNKKVVFVGVVGVGIYVLYRNGVFDGLDKTVTDARDAIKKSADELMNGTSNEEKTPSPMSEACMRFHPDEECKPSDNHPGIASDEV